jgi:uncharacterized delta-60 repeat protein
MKKIQFLILMLAITGWSNLVNAQQAGSLDLTFDPGTGIGATIKASALQADGKMLVGGSFTKGVARLNPDGSVDNTFFTGTGTNGTISAIVIENDGKIIIGGSFTSYNQSNVSSIARLNIDGTIDPTFVAEVKKDTAWTPYPVAIYSIVQQNDGRILIGGSFDTCNGTAIKNFTRLHPDGTLDTSFITGTGTDNPVYTIAIQNDGNIIIGGRFFFYNFTGGPGFIHAFIARINANGTKDSAFTVDIGPLNVSYVSTITIQEDNKILVGGSFNNCNGYQVHNLLRLQTNGTLDTTFSLNPVLPLYSEILALKLQNDGKIMVGAGKISLFSGDTVNLISRLNTNGTLDNTFTSGTGTSELINVYTIAIQNDGRIIIGGNFTSYNGISRPGIARLNNENELSVENKNTRGLTENVFPNPNNGVFRVRLTEEMKDAELRITDIFGKRIYTMKADIQQDTLSIDISNEAAGIYYLTLINKNRQFADKIVIYK